MPIGINGNFKCCICYSEQEIRKEVRSYIQQYYDDGDFYNFVCNDCFSAISGFTPMSDLITTVKRTYIEGHVVSRYFNAGTYYRALKDSPEYHHIVERRVAAEVADRLEGTSK